MKWLFSWIGSWFYRLDEDDVYQVKERMIYVYYDGIKEVKADPVVLFKRMMAVGPELSIDIKVSTSVSKDAGKAHDGVIGKIRNIFSLKSFEEGGLTELETVGLLDHFMIYCERLKKNSSPSPTSSTSSGPSGSSVNGQATGSSSDSGSVASERPTDSPALSPTE